MTADFPLCSSASVSVSASVSINNDPYCCLVCEYTTRHKGDFNKHNLTKKHIKKTTVSKEGSYLCVCGKAYHHSSSLTKHKHKCGIVLKSQSGNNGEKNGGEKNDWEKNGGEKIPTENACFLLEIKNLIVDQHRQLVVLIENIATSIQTQSLCQDEPSPQSSSQSSSPSHSPLHSPPHEKSFHLHSFLNEKCKHSINMKEFIDSLKVNLTDLENTGKYGFIKSISQFITRELGKLDVYTRPIHCSDVSRKVLYIKNDNSWQKDTDSHVMTKKIISSMNHKMNVSQILDWKNAHPTCEYSDDKLNSLYLKIIQNSMGDEDMYEKIITHLSEKIAINKKNPHYLN
jgi:hypothetical protein